MERIRVGTFEFFISYFVYFSSSSYVFALDFGLVLFVLDRHRE